MKTTYDVAARKRAVNLTLNEDLVNQTRGMTDNLSGVVEVLLGEYLTRQKALRAAQAQELKATLSIWNHFARRTGSFADEHSTL